MTDDLISRAKNLAHERHAGQCRPNAARQPKTEHLAEVASMVRKAGGSDEAVAAAWLHDIIEDTTTTLDEVKTAFGDKVALLVDELSDPPDFAALPLEQRKAKQVARLTAAHDETKLVKLCDQISNIISVTVDPPLEDWDEQTSRDYILGAKDVADICKGQSAYLDHLLDESFEWAREKYLA